ncbi:DUF3822 family protein [Flammeovirga sp. SJP92]|uniref:DUF3822 family protein n=1 Tax=Flammeovirga sp. SJP92 TaxID=1775430 RepID=UPI0007957FDE|nr:DUF3822 family protein [Flammeovirga sp. SJP92]KXX70022.1 hypothetical protein AVL50_14200 [Flammeovirga sp. SJP92]
MEDLLLESVRYSVHSNSFDVARLAEYSLHLRIHQSCLVIGVYDPENNECLALESYSYETAMNTTALIVNLHNIVQKHSFLNAAFWKKVNIISALSSFAFVPDDVADEETEQNILKLSSKFSSKKDKVFKNATNFGASVVYALPSELEEWFNEMYSNSTISYNHYANSFIQEVNNVAAGIHCYIDTDTICIINTNQDNSLSFANMFKYKTAQDMLYFILFVVDELQLSPKDTEIYIWGELNSNAEEINTLRKFISKVTFGNKPKDVLYAYQFDQEPHQHAAVDIIGNMKLYK